MKTPIFNFHDIVLFMTITECLLLALFQAALPSKKRVASNLLIAFLLSIGVAGASVMVLWNDYLHIHPFFDLVILPYILVAAVLIKGPILYLYVSALTQDSFTLKRTHALHLLPVLLCLALVAIFNLDSDDLRHRSAEATALSTIAANDLWHLTKIIPLLYGIASVYKVQRYRSHLKDQYSNFSSSEPGWLGILTVGFLLTWVWGIIVHIIAQYSPVVVADYLGIAENYVIFILINALFTYSLAYAHRLLTTKPTKIKEPTNDKPDESAIERVKRGMEVDKYYLEQNLNIEEFASRVDLPVRDVSNVINKHFGTNFFEFMNSYRVEEAKRLLADPKNADLTILDILLQSGFNSKSAFHRFFKRLVGMSPTEYRKKQLASPETAGAT
jgi:AraC-like DNA-binding protein